MHTSVGHTWVSCPLQQCFPPIMACRRSLFIRCVRRDIYHCGIPSAVRGPLDLRALFDVAPTRCRPAACGVHGRACLPVLRSWLHSDNLWDGWGPLLGRIAAPFHATQQFQSELGVLGFQNSMPPSILRVRAFQLHPCSRG